MVWSTCWQKPAPEFEAWLTGLGMADTNGRILPIDLATSPLRALAAG
jgi:ethanolamine ammonia-lyase large subunit